MDCAPEPPEMPDPPEPEPEEPEIFERPDEKPARPEKSLWDEPLLLFLGSMFVPGFVVVALGVAIYRGMNAKKQEEVDSRKGRSLLTPAEAVARATAIEQELARTGKAPKA